MGEDASAAGGRSVDLAPGVISRPTEAHMGASTLRILGSLAVVAFLVVIVLAGGGRPVPTDALFRLTGEEAPPAQVKALTDLLADQLRPRLILGEDRFIPHADVNPFGVNVFLEQEVEPEKRERVVRMAAEAGFHWLRQEFPWEDIEIHGKGDFIDRRHDPPRSAWEKYDHIVDLAEKYGLELIVRLSNPPAWSRAQGDAVGPYAPPDNFQDFADFVYAVVSRYKGRVRYYQIWNEPNIYPEWGEQPVNPEAYTQLLKAAATAARQADPNVVIIAGALAANIEYGPRDMSDLVFLKRMYRAGAAPYFDILSVQGYGLWSGPTDRRLNPRVINFSRPMLIRDLMVRYGDADKPIWISEMNWNAAPPDVEPRYGRVDLETQARYLTLAYDRILQEWPWVGVANVWYLKRPDDRWERNRQPEAYFRLLTPDFKPLPAYEAIKQYTARNRYMGRGYHDQNHWAVTYEGPWRTVSDPQAVLGSYAESTTPGARVRLRFMGTGLDVYLVTGPDAGRVGIRVDGEQRRAVNVATPSRQYRQVLTVVDHTTYGLHDVVLTVVPGPQGSTVRIDGFVVRGPKPWPRFLSWDDVLFWTGVVLLFTVGRRVRERREAEKGQVDTAAGSATPGSTEGGARA